MQTGSASPLAPGLWHPSSSRRLPPLGWFKGGIRFPLEWVQPCPWNWVEVTLFFSVINADNFESMILVREHSFQVKIYPLPNFGEKKSSSFFSNSIIFNACFFFSIELKSSLVEKIFLFVLTWIFLSNPFKVIYKVYIVISQKFSIDKKWYVCINAIYSFYILRMHLGSFFKKMNFKNALRI